jgi:hypothetical protein
MTKRNDGAQLTPRQEKEVALVKRLAAEKGFEIESIHSIANSTALEYRLESHRSIRGDNTDTLTGQMLEALISRQLEAA